MNTSTWLCLGLCVLVFGGAVARIIYLRWTIGRLQRKMLAEVIQAMHPGWLHDPPENEENES